MKIIVIFLFTLFSVGFTLKAQKPNVIYILTDQWRASAFGYTGDPNVKTPHIDQFAQEALNFTNAVSVAPVCTPYRASLLTGCYPTSTGMFLNDLYLPEEELCMAEIFKQEGYHTAYLGKWHLDGHGRLNNVSFERRQGFDYWKALECSHDYNNMPFYENNNPELQYWEEYSPFAIAKDAQKYISDQAAGSKPFLLYVSLGTPHFPHRSAPQKYQDMYPKSEIQVAPNVPRELHEKVQHELKGYYAHCTATDQAIGDLLEHVKSLDLMDNTIVVFTSDHGEMMGAHGGRIKSKQMAWDESAHIPFLMSYPKLGDRKGSTIHTPLTTPDILPTLLGLAGIDIPKTIEGEDLTSWIKSNDAEKDRAALFMNVCPFGFEYPNEEYRGIRTRQYTYVATTKGPSMFYDHINDPYQLNNLLGKKEHDDIQQQLHKSLVKALHKIGDEDFKERNYYLNKFNLVFTNDERKVIDYQAFLKGDGVVVTPQKTKTPANK